MKQSPDKIKSQLESDVNIYQRLASIPREIADKITNAKTGGGRSLNAIHDSTTLSASEKHLLLFLGSQLNYTRDFINQYRYMSLSLIAEKMSVTRRNVSQLLNGYKSKKGHVKGLIEKGYVSKQIASLEEQEKGWANHYCLTPKIFDEYIITMLDETKIECDPSETVSPPQRNYFTTPSETVSPKVPIIQTPKISPNAAAQPSTAVKRCRPPSKKKMKLWHEKSHDEKKDTLLNMAVDAHMRAVKQKKANPFPFDDMPDMLKPIIEGYGIEEVKVFFEDLNKKNDGCDARILEHAIKESVVQKIKKSAIDREDNNPPLSVSTIHQPEEKIKPKTENFPENVWHQVETNMMNANNLSKKESMTVKIENFPPRLKKFYDSLNPKNQKNLRCEIVRLGMEDFLKFRAPCILKCTYDQMFVENVSSQLTTA